MSDEEEDNIFLNFEISDTEEDNSEKKSRRTGQTEADFQAVRREYKAKVENGEIHKTIVLPLGPGANKQHLQLVLHAVEELYFFRRYQDTIDFITKVYDAEGQNDTLDEETKQLLSMYESRCRQKLSSSA